jgi:hypothetical protein
MSDPHDNDEGNRQMRNRSYHDDYDSSAAVWTSLAAIALLIIAGLFFITRERAPDSAANPPPATTGSAPSPAR